MKTTKSNRGITSSISVRRALLTAVLYYTYTPNIKLGKTNKTMATATKAQILATYRTLTRLVKALPSNQKPERQMTEVRQMFRKNATLTDPIDIENSIRQAGEKISYLRIVTPKKSTDQAARSRTGTKRWVYTKDGTVQVEGEGTKRDGNGRVLSNWDGNNLDPCSVKIHNGQLKRMGFANNLHAKGIF